MKRDKMGHILHHQDLRFDAESDNGATHAAGEAEV